METFGLYGWCDLNIKNLENVPCFLDTKCKIIPFLSPF